MALAKKRSRKAKGSSGISCRGLTDMQAGECFLDIQALNELLLFFCRWNRDHNMCLQKIPVIAGTNRDTPSIEGIRLQKCSWQRRQVRESGMAQQSEQAFVNICSNFYAESSMAQSCRAEPPPAARRFRRVCLAFIASSSLFRMPPPRCQLVPSKQKDGFRVCRVELPEK